MSDTAEPRPPEPSRTPCPICKRAVRVPPEPTAADPKPLRGKYPFCSERCAMADLGRWLTGAYQIPVSDADDDEERERPQG